MGVEEVELDTNAPAFVVAGDGGVGLILAHGGGEGDGRGYFLDEATELAALGATVVVPSCGIPLVGDLARDEAAIDRVVMLQRRALDLLAARGATQLGFFGHSAGGLQGATARGKSCFPREPPSFAITGSHTALGCAATRRRSAHNGSSQTTRCPT